MSSVLKKIAAPFLLATFLSVVFFGFVAMGYNPSAMRSDCPFSAMGTPSCPQDMFVMTLHHLSAYQSFLSVPMVFGLTELMSALLIVVYLLVRTISIPIFECTLGNRLPSRAPPISARTRKITRWLSLFENSPSLI